MEILVVVVSVSFYWSTGEKWLGCDCEDSSGQEVLVRLGRGGLHTGRG